MWSGELSTGRFWKKIIKHDEILIDNGGETVIYVLYCPICDESFEESQYDRKNCKCPSCNSNDIMLLYELEENEQYAEEESMV